MTDLANYSATETLRDGRTIEIRAQRSQKARAALRRHRTPAEP